MKRFLAMLLAVVMVFGLAACGQTAAPAATSAPGGNEPAPAEEVPSYTYNTYSSSLASNWNPHTWETNADSNMFIYLTSSLVDYSILDSENGVFQWVYEMATEVTDVTAEHQDDLERYAVTLLDGKTASEVTEGYVYELKLRPEACWSDGTPITADDYVYSLQQLLAPEMHNYRANNYISGQYAWAGAAAYYYQGSTAYIVIGEKTSDYLASGGNVEDLYVDCWDFWGAEGYIDADGNEVPQYLSVVDEVAYSADGAGDDEFSGASLYEEYLGAGAAYESYAPDYLYTMKSYADGVDFDSVGFYKVDDYTVRIVLQSYVTLNYFLYSIAGAGGNWIVYKDLYEAGKDTSGELVTTDYGTTVENTISYGPYILESLQPDKQMVFVQNPNWYGWEQGEDGTLVSFTEFEVDGAKQQQYRATRIVIDVLDDTAAKQAFLKGDLSRWVPTAEDLMDYGTSDQLYKAPETYTMRLFFNTDIDTLKAMDESKGNTNSIVMSNEKFRKAFSLCIDRSEWVTATEGYIPAFSMLNSLYFYDIFDDPTSSYRNSDEAMQAVVNLYGVEYGPGTPYATLKDAHDSINGYNLTEAKELMTQACQELVADGLYTEGDPIYIRLGYKKGAIDSADLNQVALLNKYLSAAVEGTGFGTVTLEAVGNIEDRYSAVPNGEFAIGYGAWGGAAFSPFGMFRVYCDPEYVDPINEAGCWDPSRERLTLNVEGEDVTMTWQEWSQSMEEGAYVTADNSVKLSILAQIEEAYLKLYYCIPLASSAIPEIMSYKVSYYTDEYNIMYAFGELRLMQFNYSDAEWAEFVASQGGALHYE